MSLFNELKRRNVLRVGAAYAVVGWLIIQIVETIFPAFGFGDAAIRIATIALAIGLIPALIFAWAFELTPEGLKKESEVDRSQSITPHTGKKLDRMIMVVLALALGYFAFDKFVLDPQRDAAKDEQVAVQVEEAKQQGRTEALVESYGEKSIAVLAFDDMSQAGDQEYLSDGIAEELLNLLAKIPELRVISRSSAFSFKGKDLPLTEIAQQLNVAHILEGSVRKAGNRVRITAQLIEARSDTHLWSETYDRDLDDIFAIQDDIAATVVSQLKITLLGDVHKAQQVEPDAYTLYLQARHFGRLGTPEAWEKSNALYEEALDIDPAFSEAWVGLATNLNNLAGSGLMPRDEGYARAREAGEKALAADPDYPGVYNVLGWIAMVYDDDLVQAAELYKHGLRLGPSYSRIIGNSSILLSSLGRIEEAIAVGEYMTARDPVNPIGHANLASNYMSAARWDDVIKAIDNVLRLSPNYYGARALKGMALLFKGEAEAALDEIQREEYEVSRLIALPMAYHDLGDAAASDRALGQLIENYERDAAYNIAYVLAYRGEADRAFEWLDKAVEYNDPGLNDILTESAFHSIHEDPRWDTFLERSGMAQKQRQWDAIEFEVTLPGR